MNEFGKVAIALKGLRSAGPVNSSTIQDAERTLNVRFPPSYREFLSRFGAVFGRGLEIAGLVDDPAANDPPLRSDVVTGTKCIRKSAPSIPNSYVLIATDGGDFYFYLNTEKTYENGECPVVKIGPGVESREVATDFVEFVEKLSRREI